MGGDSVGERKFGRLTRWNGLEWIGTCDGEGEEMKFEAWRREKIGNLLYLDLVGLGCTAFISKRLRVGFLPLFAVRLVDSPNRSSVEFICPFALPF